MAYEGAKLLEKFKKHGILIEVENGAQKALDATAEWLRESAAETETKVDDVVVPLALAAVEPIAKSQIDKIDGEPG